MKLGDIWRRALRRLRKESPAPTVEVPRDVSPEPKPSPVPGRTKEEEELVASIGVAAIALTERMKPIKPLQDEEGKTGTDS